MKTIIRAREIQLLIIIVISILPVYSFDDEKYEAINLSGSDWKFSIGEKDNWRDMSFDDSNWESVYVPSAWEDEGFYGYNGFGFYRKRVLIPANLKSSQLYLKLGYIDDVDEVHFNGQLIGSKGAFPPHYVSAYNAKREYMIPSNIIRYDQSNIITVKVYDSHGGGGIVSGDVGIYKSAGKLNFDINLQGVWKFKTSDSERYSQPAYDDSAWDEISVPGFWEDQGYRNYDGYAWYRITFKLRETINDEKVVIVLGKIDDYEEVYLNGKLVGSMGDLDNISQTKRTHWDSWKENRGYYVDAALLKKGNNTLAIRVYDGGGGGGIHQGPLGIVSQSDYIYYWRERKNSKKNRW